MESLLKQAAAKIPAEIRKVILEEGFIDKAVNVAVTNSPMEFLFDVYEEFIDLSNDHNDWQCNKCREHILHQFKKLKPYL